MMGTYNTFGLSLALLEGVLVLELGSHIDGLDAWYLGVSCFRCDERESWDVSWSQVIRNEGRSLEGQCNL